MKTLRCAQVDTIPFAYDAKNMPQACDEHTAVVYERFMYVFGGYVACEPTNSFFKYDFNFKMWRLVTSIRYLLEERPCPRAGHSAVNVGDSMFVFGGRDMSKNRLNDLWRFDYKRELWYEIKLR